MKAPGKSENTASAANASSKPPQIGSVPMAANRIPKPLNSRLAGLLLFGGGLGIFVTGHTFSLRKRCVGEEKNCCARIRLGVNRVVLYANRTLRKHLGMPGIAAFLSVIEHVVASCDCAELTPA